MIDRDESELEAGRLPFTEHLRELRTRTMRAVGYVIVGFGICWVWHEALFAWLMGPYTKAIVNIEDFGSEMIAFRSLIEPIVVYLKTSLLVGSLLATPFVLLEIWLFVAPGLYKSERRMAIPFLGSSVFCFLGGAAFCRYLVLEPAMTVLLKFAGENTTPTIMMQEYFSFTTRMLFVFGALFEMPVALAFLAMVGIVTHRGLIKNWRYAIVISFVVGAILTPPDPLTQLALAVPLTVLYALSIGIAWMITTRREARAAEAAATEGDAGTEPNDSPDDARSADDAKPEPGAVSIDKEKTP